MKKIILSFIILTGVVFSQYKEDANKPVDFSSNISENSGSSLLLGFINPNNFSMKHSFSMSYSMFGNNGVALGVYTNRMQYNFTDDLSIQADISFVNSPYSSFGDEFANQINGIYLTQAKLKYKISENSKLTLQFNQIPPGFYNPYNNSYYFRSNFLYDSFHNDFDN
ncbi:MAG: hypothetical protein JXA68_01035 [Ignavibacteriales bacterium]|nr:hypothetical protein [Ignavibacteriales bacterium]